MIVALGSNLPGQYPTCQALLEAALGRFPNAGLRIRAVSRWWRSKAWPDPADPEYFNGVAIVDTLLSAPDLLLSLRGLESAFGRRRDTANDPRTLDLDLIAYARRRLSSEHLSLPHPRAAQRRFVMGPLAEIAPDWRHPVLGLTAAALAREASIGIDATPCGADV